MEWRIFPLDVVFFRGTEPMNAGEAGVITSRFPPSPEVVQGFVRTALLMTMGISLQEYGRAVAGKGTGSAAVQEAIELLGGIDNLGELDLYGPYLIRQQGEVVERWYPAPLDLRQKGNGGWHRGELDGVVECDMGAIPFLPKLEEGERGVEGGMWIADDGLTAYLRGEAVAADRLVTADRLFGQEQRVGIERDAQAGTAREGMLYSPVFVRLDDRAGPLGIGVRVEGVDRSLQESCAGLHRLGGEGRLAAVEIHAAPPMLARPDGAEGRLVLLTPARWGGRWIPLGFQGDGTGWRGSLEGIALTVVTAAVGKPWHIGGWDLAHGRPKPAEACAPAGSVYFLGATEGIDLGPLHNRKLGGRRQAGFGHVVVGR